LSITDPRPRARVIRAGATLDAAAAAELRREAMALLARSVAPLVVDLSAVRTAEPAAALAALRDLAYEAGDADVDLRLVDDPAAPEVIRAILVGETLFELYPSLDAALRGAADPAGDAADPAGDAAPPPYRHPCRPPAPEGS
jgi:anti-anti-sigma regulatory factor